MVELAAIRFRITLEEEGKRSISDDALRPGKYDNALNDVIGPKPTLRPEHLDTLVVSIDSAPSIRNLTQRARFHAQRYNGGIHITRLADRRIDHHACRCE